MRKLTNNSDTFFKLLRAGLWENHVQLSQIYSIDYQNIYQLAEEQSVVGLITAGFEYVDVRVPKENVLTFVGNSLQMELRNQTMNSFIAKLVERMHSAGIYTLLLKGQGIAQCYERPLWRACGDVDLLLDNHGYTKAKNLLIPLAESVENEDIYCKHIGMVLRSWVVEIHGNQHTELSSRIDNILDNLQKEAFEIPSYRVWRNGNVDVLLLGIDYDVLFVFTHFLKHFYKGGIGLRQICDWCRLIWVYKDVIDCKLLEKRLKKMRLTTEWKTFAAFAVTYLGMPKEAMPLYEKDVRWQRKANRVCTFILKVGNFGNNRNNTYYCHYPYLIRKIISMNRRVEDIINHLLIFPVDSVKFLPNLFYNGLRSAVNGL